LWLIRRSLPQQRRAWWADGTPWYHRLFLHRVYKQQIRNIVTSDVAMDIVVDVYGAEAKDRGPMMSSIKITRAVAPKDLKVNV
jgi:hypothetical protein